MTGTVKSFNDKKGYGFITQQDGADLFVHYTKIEGKGYRRLFEGDLVEYEIEQGAGRPQACKVTVLAKAALPSESEPGPRVARAVSRAGILPGN